MNPGVLKVICAWCRTVIRDGDPERVSHGICPSCSTRILAECEPVNEVAA